MLLARRRARPTAPGCVLLFERTARDDIHNLELSYFGSKKMHE